MSIHPSLRGANSLIGDRSVYTRVERIQKLIEDGQLSEEDSAYGLPKVRTVRKVKKKKKEAAEAVEAGGAEEGAEGTDAAQEESA